jgi:hypothetical protein
MNVPINVLAGPRKGNSPIHPSARPPIDWQIGSFQERIHDAHARFPRVAAPQLLRDVVGTVLARGTVAAERAQWVNAITRSGLPLPLTIYSGAATTMAPVGGS